MVTEPASVASSVPRSLETMARWSWRLLVVGAAILITAIVLARLRVVVIPVIVGILLAALLSPLVDLLARVMPRLAATWAVLLSALAALAGLGYTLTRTLQGSFGDLSRDLEAATTEIEDWLKTGPLGFSQERVDSLAARLDESRQGLLSGWLDRPFDSARLLVDIATGILLAIALTFFFLKDGPWMWRWLLARIRPERQPVIDRAGRAAFASVQAWLRGTAITGVVDAVIIGIALVIIGVPAVIPLAIITFFGAFFPIVGATVAGAMAAAVALAANGIGDAIIVSIVVLAVQQIEGDVLLPMVMYRQVSLHPALILFVLALGGAIAGIVGALLAVPIAAALTAAISAGHEGEIAHPLPDDEDDGHAVADGDDKVGADRDHPGARRDGAPPQSGPDRPATV